jgi:hypothetical protein
MTLFIAGIVCGALISYLIWRNNKKKYMNVLNSIETISNSEKTDKLKAKIKSILSAFKK